ncbi:MAG: S53 family peptidase [Terriglobales bacterium]
MKLFSKSWWFVIQPVLIFAASMFVLLALVVASDFAQAVAKPSVSEPQNLGPEDPSKLITVSVWLKQHNKAALDELVRLMYLPGSPTYHHFLTREQYRSWFAPTAEDAAQVRDYLMAHNLTVTAADRFNHYLVAEGHVSDVQNAFNVQLSRVNFKNNIHRVSSGAASVQGPVGNVILGVEGLTDFTPHLTLAERHNSRRGRALVSQPLSIGNLQPPQNPCLHAAETVTFTSAGHGPTATYYGNVLGTDTNPCIGYTAPQLQTAYGLNALHNKGWDGTGQTIIIVDPWGSDTILQDANTFSSAYGLPPLTPSNFQTYYSGGKTHCGSLCLEAGGNAETSLDVEWAHTFAPGANIALVLAPDESSLDIAELWAVENPEGIVTPYANNDLGYVISNSWGFPELLDLLYGGQSRLQTEYEVTELAAALGISANFASGDGGDLVQEFYEAFGITVPPSVIMPASSPYATGVGGTSIFLDRNNEMQLQMGWGNNLTVLTYGGKERPFNPPQELGFFGGSGGGSSAVWPEPAFQRRLGKEYRQVPDISYFADFMLEVSIVLTINGSQVFTAVGGTSASTPMFSGMWAVANQAAGAKAPLGQAAPMLYSLPADAITDLVPVKKGVNVRGEITDPPAPPLVETAADLVQPLENTTIFLSALNLFPYPEPEWEVYTWGTDTSLVTAPGWDPVTGVGTPNGLKFIEAVVAAAP